MRLRTTAAIVGALAAVAFASPAYADQVTLTIDPQQITITPEQGGTQTVHIDGDRTKTIVVTFDPGQPVGAANMDISRVRGDCHRTDGAEYTCEGYGDVTITYAATPAEGIAGGTTQLVAKALESTGRAFGSVVVEAPAPPTTDPPAPTSAPPTQTSSQAVPPATTAAATTTLPATSAPATTAVVSTVTEPESAGGLPVQVWAWGGSVVFTGAAAAVGALFLRRRREET